MPTKTRDAVAEITEEIASLEERRDAAVAQIRDASNELSGIRERQNALSLDVLGGVEAAVKENDELTEAYIREERRVAVARAAVAQAEEKIDNLKARRDEEQNRIHLQKAQELGRKRYRLEQEAEEHLSALKAALDGVREIDREQRQELQYGGEGDGPHRYSPLSGTLEHWLATRIGGPGNYIPGISSAAAFHYEAHTLAELDELAYEPPEDVTFELAPESQEAATGRDGWVTVAEAAEILGASVEAVRGRIKRGTLQSERQDGAVYVWLEADQSPHSLDS